MNHYNSAVDYAARELLSNQWLPILFITKSYISNLVNVEMSPCEKMNLQSCADYTIIVINMPEMQIKQQQYVQRKLNGKLKKTKTTVN